MVHFLQLALAECVPCLGVMGTMYLEDVMSRVPRSPHSLQAQLAMPKVWAWRLILRNRM